jgi:L-histidine N-alpha-methyltransferase
MRHEVMEGLSRPQKEISPKYFYDARGSRLFDEITELPEYYLTRVEWGLLERWIPEWTKRLGPKTLVELGSGSARKTRLLLDALGPGSLFVPVDVSEASLQETAQRLRAEYPGLAIAPRVADVAVDLGLPEALPRPAMFAFLGSTIGNFTHQEAVRLLQRVRERMMPGDLFVLGVDLQPGAAKSVVRLEAAYNDARGVTAAFNSNSLHVLNQELGADFDPAAFRHLAFYDAREARIEMHLVSLRAQEVHIPGAGTVAFREGESLRTEISCKYNREGLERLLAEAGLRVQDWQEDTLGFYALVRGSLS